MSHSQLSLEVLAQLVTDPKEEGRLYDEMLAVRERYFRIGVPFRFDTSQEAIAWSHRALEVILPAVLRHRDAAAGDPGHGSGHWCRDYIHSLRLAHDPQLEPRYIPACILGGTLHDIGTLFLDRYADKNRAFRHAEAGALIVRAAALESGAMNPDQADLIAYVIAAHTHYLRPSEVTCADGVTRTVKPYYDEDFELVPNPARLEVWLPRWADRLDCSGPCMVGRHYLTLAKDHEDFNGDGFYKVSFAEAMRPLLRTPEEIKAAGGKLTMLEHMRMFANSQTNESPYGRFDRGVMVKIRDRYRLMLECIIEKVVRPVERNEGEVLGAWTSFLGTRIEPSQAGWQAALTLRRNFDTLDADTRRAWTSGFWWTMQLYAAWYESTSWFLFRKPTELFRLPGVTPDVRNVIAPIPAEDLDDFWMYEF